MPFRNRALVDFGRVDFCSTGFRFAAVADPLLLLSEAAAEAALRSLSVLQPPQRVRTSRSWDLVLLD